MREFFAMGGYAFFIWMAYGMATLLCVAEILIVRSRSKKARLMAHYRTTTEQKQSARLKEAQ